MKRDRAFKAMLLDFAHRLGLSESEIDVLKADDPDIGKSMHNFAALSQISAEELSTADSEWLETTSYPTRNCLDPSEVRLWAEGGLLADRLNHIESCRDCAELVSMLSDRTRSEEIWSRVNETVNTILAARERKAIIVIPSAIERADGLPGSKLGQTESRAPTTRLTRAVSV
jgi:hypothetical protein